MLSIKPGARIESLSGEILTGIFIVERIFDRYGFNTVITEGSGGQHSFGSKHYTGQAVDIRSKEIDTEAIRDRILKESVEALGSNFDFLLEDKGEPNEHFHLEYDPKRKG